MSYTIELYNIDTTTSAFSKIDILTTFSSLSFFEKLNGIGGAVFTLALQDPKAIISNLYCFKTQVLIRRDGYPVWIGVITNLDGSYSNVEGNITVNCLTYLSHLLNRFTASNYQKINTDVGDIILDLISYTQGLTQGQLGITEGASETIGNISDTLSYASIGQAIINYSDNIVGFDFTMTPVMDANNELESVAINIYKGLGNIRNDLPSLELGVNVQTVSFATQGEVFNHITALGSGTGGSVSSTVQQNVYSQQGFTKREAILKYSDISVINTLVLKAARYLTQTQAQRLDINVSLKPESILGYGVFSLGDVLNCNLVKDDTLINFTGTGRVVELRVDVDSQGTEYVTPKLQYIA